MDKQLVKQEEKEERREQVQGVANVRVKVEEDENDYRSHEPEMTKRVKRQQDAPVEPQEQPVIEPQLMQVKQENIEPKIEEIPLPQWDYWHYTDEYVKEGNTFIKADSDFLKVVRAKQPLPDNGIHSFQFKPCSLTTFSFGITTEILKDQPHISQKHEQGLFLTSFSNGTSVLNVDGAIKHKNMRHQMHVGVGASMKVKINMSRRQLIFIKSGLIFKEPISHQFLGHHIYPFFQVKTRQARFQIFKTQ